MAVLRASLRIIARVAAGLAALAVLLWVVAAVVNRHDEPPSESTRRFTELYRSWPPVPDGQNAFVYAMGFEVAAGEDPYAMGLRRIAWFRESAGRLRDDSEDPLGSASHRPRSRPAEAEDVLSPCGEDTAECVAAFSSASGLADKWMAADELLLPRYLELLSRSGWRDESPNDLSFPLPPFGATADAQRLLLLTAYSAAERGDVAEVHERLDADLRFWRGVLRSTDMLITKMVATAALNRHFEWGNLVLRRLPVGSAAAAVPSGWSAPLTDDERSMRRVMTGEWLFVSVVLQRFEPDLVLSSDSWWDRLWASLFEQVYQPQDTVNRYADYYWGLSETFDAPLEGYETVLVRASMLTQETVDSAFQRPLYNLGGNMHLAEASDFTRYAARVADIEGVRRAAFAAVTLRDAAVAPADLAAALRTSELRNPYDGAPLQWDATDQAIVFRGLQRGAWGEHRLHY
jgi:hypothetical protein